MSLVAQELRRTRSLGACALGLLALTACASEPARRTPVSPDTTRTALVFPSSEMLQLAALESGPESSRNDGRLGVASTAAPQMMIFERDVHDRQLVLNGVPQPMYRQTLRAREQLVQ
ncbi:MAG: hypothetical protein U0572_02560 [Phycisphaerales bacterium]